MVDLWPTNEADQERPWCSFMVQAAFLHAGNPFFQHLEKYFTVYAVDRRGRGESGDGSNYAIEREFDDVAAVVDPIGNGVDLLGHSFGAVCALEAGLRTSHHSPSFSKAAIEAVNRALPNSRIVVLPGQQHIAMDTAPDLFVREVLAFLAKPA
jgi:pimeloyl-ACP methyl ester carboxylesterase